MTHTDFDQGTATLVRAADAEVIGFLPQMIRLLAAARSGSSATAAAKGSGSAPGPG